MHHPWIEGYKPRSNFQESLRDAVLRHTPEAVSVADAALAVAADPASIGGPVDWELTTAPTVEVSADYAHHRRSAKRDYVAIGEAKTIGCRYPLPRDLAARGARFKVGLTEGQR